MTLSSPEHREAVSDRTRGAALAVGCAPYTGDAPHTESGCSSSPSPLSNSLCQGESLGGKVY